MVALTQQLLSQHFPPSFSKVMSTLSVAGSEASSGQPPSKKAKVVKTLKFGEVEVEKVSLHAYMGTAGKVSYTPMLDEWRVRFNLTPEGTLVKSNWGFETRYKLNPEKKPSFLGGPPTTLKSECLEINVELTTEQAAFITSLDLKVSKEFLKNKHAAWSPAVKFTKSGIPRLKVKVPVMGYDLTDLKVVDDGTFHKGAGWEFLKPWMAKTRDFGPCKAKLVLVTAYIYDKGGNSGIQFHATEMTLMAIDNPHPRTQFESAQDDEEAMMADFLNDDL